MSKKRLLFSLILFSLIVYGCQADIKEKTAEERLAEGNYDGKTTDHMVSNEYGQLEQNIDALLEMGGMIGDRHYDELEASVNRLEKQGLDVSRLREKLARLEVAPREGEREYDSKEIPSEPQNEKLQHQPVPENDPQTSVQSFKIGLLAPRGCEGNGSFLLGTSPIALDDLQKILPMGMMSTQHITPTDHQYFHTVGYSGPKDDTENLDRFKLYAPADGEIVDIGTIYGRDDYRIVIAHTCTFYTIFIHVDKLADRIIKAIAQNGTVPEHSWERIPVKEGEVIGTIGTGKFDFSVVDENVTLAGFARHETYDNKETGEVWKTHTVDTFDYFKEPVRSKLLEKNLRKVAPFGGKIDYGIDGKLVGNWFVEGTGGYRGLGNWDYWLTHLSIAYDALDPEHIVVSIGDFGGTGQQFGVTGNSPDPKDIDVKSGIVKYELAPYDYYSNNKKWDGISYAEDIEARNTNEVRGTALFEMIDGRRLKAEFFPEKKANEVNGFTSSAKVYER